MNQDRAEILARFRKEMAVMALIVLISMVLSVVWSFGFTFVLEPCIAEFAFIETFSDLAGLAMIGLLADFAWMVWKLDQAVEDFGKNETVPLPQSLAELHRNLLEILDQGSSRRRAELVGQVVLVLVEVAFAHSAYSAAMLVESLILLAIQQPMLRRFSDKLEDELPGMAE
ncbi:MAG: hypothetical protein KH009_03185 [Clostridiales bacterium]|nr:hypothetical protein [Clostridiales bacterium]